MSLVVNAGITLILAALSYTSFAQTNEADPSNTTDVPLSDYKLRVEERQNPITSIGYEAVNPDNIPQREDRWSDFLPIWGEEARDQGYVLPRPFGLSFIGFHQKQPFDINSIGLAFRNNQSQAINTLIDNTVSASDLVVTDSTFNLRADVWLLPFFNVYGLLGKTDARADLTIDIDARLPNQSLSACNLLNLNFEQTSGGLLPKGNCIIQASTPVKLDINGDSLGAGITVAGGYGDFFGMFDINYTVSDLNVATEDAEVIVSSARIGWNGAFGSLGGSLWFGAMHQDVKQSLDIVIPGINGGPSGIAVIIEQEASSPVNYLLGGRLNFTEEWEILIETNAGFADRQQFMMQLSYRI